MQIQEEQSLFVALSSRSMCVYIYIYSMAGREPCVPAWGSRMSTGSKDLMVCLYGGSILKVPIAFSTGTTTYVQIHEPMGTVLFQTTTKGKTCILLEHGNFM